MKIFLYCLLFLSLVTSCKNGSKHSKTEQHKQLSDLKKDFKYKNLQSFRIDSFEWGTRAKHYNELDSLSYRLIWQGPQDRYNHNGYDRSFLYAWQERDPQFQECAMLAEMESDNGPSITYFIFDKQGKMIDRFIAAARISDGGWDYEAYGKFVKPDVYEATCISQEFTEMDSINQKERYEGDTTVIQYSIAKNGKVSEKQLYKRKFVSEE